MLLQKKCKYIYDYLRKIDNNTSLDRVINSHDFVVNQIAKFSRFHSDRLFIDWTKIFINKIFINGVISWYYSIFLIEFFKKIH